jgi:hypothetical protein|tara:strand:+ start:737 stop:988 length:252 start_codon:yes stop_codon:yes gene_type:complete
MALGFKKFDHRNAHLATRKVVIALSASAWVGPLNDAAKKLGNRDAVARVFWKGRFEGAFRIARLVRERSRRGLNSGNQELGQA